MLRTPSRPSTSRARQSSSWLTMCPRERARRAAGGAPTTSSTAHKHYRTARRPGSTRAGQQHGGRRAAPDQLHGLGHLLSATARPCRARWPRRPLGGGGEGRASEHVFNGDSDDNHDTDDDHYEPHQGDDVEKAPELGQGELDWDTARVQFWLTTTPRLRRALAGPGPRAAAQVLHDTTYPEEPIDIGAVTASTTPVHVTGDI